MNDKPESTYYIACSHCGVTLERKLPRRPGFKHYCDGCFDRKHTREPAELSAEAERAAILETLDGFIAQSDTKTRPTLAVLRELRNIIERRKYIDP